MLSQAMIGLHFSCFNNCTTRCRNLWCCRRWFWGQMLILMANFTPHFRLIRRDELEPLVLLDDRDLNPRAVVRNDVQPSRIEA